MLALPVPGQPFDAADVLEAMRTSRRPGGVPDELETPAIAEAVAAELWTLDGEPWEQMVAGGSCGPQTCTLELSGRPSGAAGEDLYVFSVTPATSGVERLETTLQGVPPTLFDELDAAARGGWDGDLEGFILASVRWLPPPDDGQFLLAYRSGGEEGSPGLDLRLDVERGTVEPA